MAKEPDKGEKGRSRKKGGKSGKSGKKSKKYERYKRGKISAGSYDLNKWLYGGYEKGVISTLYGPAGSGKTNLCILAAVSQAKKGNKVLYIDTEGGFSPERVKQVLNEDKKLDKVLENIILLKAASFEEQKKVFQNLEKRLKGIGLIIVDGMTMLYRLELGDAIKEKEDEKIKNINRELAKQMRILASLARKNNIPVLATNQVYSDFVQEGEERRKEDKYHMVGGDIMKYWSKCIIELTKQGKARRARLVKHRSQPEKELDFYITKRGVRKKGFF